jgi:hypothetical protein
MLFKAVPALPERQPLWHICQRDTKFTPVSSTAVEISRSQLDIGSPSGARMPQPQCLAERPILTTSELTTALASFSETPGPFYIVTKGREPGVYMNWCIAWQ